MNQISHIKILEGIKDISDREVYDNIVHILYQKSSLNRDVNKYIQELKYLKNVLVKNNIYIDTIELGKITKITNITDSEVQEYIKLEKDNLLKKTELEKHKARRRYNNEGKFEVYKEAKYVLYLYEFEPALVIALNLKIRQRGDSFTITKGNSKSKLELVLVE